MKKEFASKENIKMIQGIAVMLMVFHHLFGFPDRISATYYAPFDFNIIHLETMLAYFGRICVAIFIFCSGYGLYNKYKKMFVEHKWTLLKGYKIIFFSIKKFYLRYWIVFIFFIPYGFYSNIYEFIPLQLIKNIFGIACTYNKEWWYVYTYLRLLIVFPLLFNFVLFFIKRNSRMKLFAISLIVIFLLLFVVYKYDGLETSFLISLIMFYIGIIVAEFNILELINCNIKKLSFGDCIVMVTFMIAIYIRLVVSSKLDLLIVPIIIFCLLYLLNSKYVLSFFKYLLSIEGRYCQYIWLTHTFLSYYYFQNQLYSLSISWVIFLVCLIICTGIGMVLEKILVKLHLV